MLHYVAGRSLEEFGEAAIDRHAGDLLLGAEVFVALAAGLATPHVQWIHGTPTRSPISEFAGRASFLHHAADYLMPENQRPLGDSGKLLPIAVRHVQIGVANPASFDLNQDLIAGGLGAGNLLDDERFLNWCRTAAPRLFASEIVSAPGAR